jgi:hypothetical protein
VCVALDVNRRVEGREDPALYRSVGAGSSIDLLTFQRNLLSCYSLLLVLVLPTAIPKNKSHHLKKKIAP